LGQTDASSPGGPHLSFDVVDDVLPDTFTKGGESVEATPELSDQPRTKYPLDGIVFVLAGLPTRK
jgi:hypothetical protein